MPDRQHVEQLAREALRESMRREGHLLREDVMHDDDEITLTPRERAVAHEAASIAVQEMANKFYRQIGETVVTKVLVWIGMAAIGFAFGKGWFPKL